MPIEARAYPRPLPNPEWLGKRQEEILEPGLAIVDPHHHLWDHPGSRYLLDELLADVNSGHNIVATVFIQCGSGYRTSGPEEMRCIGESEFVRAIAEEADRRGTKTQICAGIVSFADLRLPNADARHPPDRGLRPRDRRRLLLCAAAGPDERPEFPPRLEAAAGA